MCIIQHVPYHIGTPSHVLFTSLSRFRFLLDLSSPTVKLMIARTSILSSVGLHEFPAHAILKECCSFVIYMFH